MKETKLIMGMPVTVVIEDVGVKASDFKKVFDYFRSIDRRFSTYKKTSEISQINEGKLSVKEASEDMQEIFRLAEATKQATNRYFDIQHNGYIDPSGIVKGWAILHASEMLRGSGFQTYFVDAGGDIQVSGTLRPGGWKVGIRNPFNRAEIVKTISVKTEGVATSGTAIRGQHIYSPKENSDITEIVSLTVIGQNIYEADRFATAAFAMGRKGIAFIEKRDGLEGYLIDKDGIATMTSGFEQYVV